MKTGKVGAPMALDKTLKTAILDISLLHLLQQSAFQNKKNKQSSKRTAKKIIELCKNQYADFPKLSEKDPSYQVLINLIENRDFIGLRDWIHSFR